MASESRMQGVQAGKVAGGRGRGARFRHLYERRLGLYWHNLSKR